MIFYRDFKAKYFIILMEPLMMKAFLKLFLFFCKIKSITSSWCFHLTYPVIKRNVLSMKQVGVFQMSQQFF